MVYGKKEAKMMHGFAILCMLILHLFCRKGNEVFGTPLIWLNEDTPLVYVFGFFSEICVAIYAMCAGYAQYVLYMQNKGKYRMKLRRILKLMMNYWIVLFIFSVIALILGPDCGLTIRPLEFIKCVFLLYSYNGAWWFLHTYVLLMLIPSVVLLAFPKKINAYVGIGICIVFQFMWSIASHFDWLAFLSSDSVIVSTILTEVLNLIGVLPAFYIGAFLCKGEFIDKVNAYYEKKVDARFKNWIILIGFAFIITADYLIHKALLTTVVALVVFVLFNVWKKSMPAEKIFSFLGKHSTNIWLCHMFFYARVFPGLVTVARYPVLILLFMIILCVATSYVIMSVLRFLNCVPKFIKSKIIT